MPKLVKDYISDNLLKLIFLIGILILAFIILDSIKSDKAEDKLKVLEILTAMGGAYYASTGIKEHDKKIVIVNKDNEASDKP